jgi:CubicO group peptidase (beta-lactamase class C family)
MKQVDSGALRSWLDDRAARHEFSGVALVRSGDDTLFEHAAGLAHRGFGVPISLQTRFQVASVTKMITAATALRLVERGALSLERPLTSFLPPSMRPEGLDERHTLHHLLSHTSGLANYHDDEDETWASFTSAWDRVPVSKARGPADVFPLFSSLPAVSDPGEFRYADANFILAGMLIEWVEGKPFDEVASREVLVPAGMTDSGFFQLDLEPERLASAYLVTDDPPEAWRSNIYSVPAGGMPDGGMTATAEDLARFLDALGEGRLLTDKSLELMLTPHGVEEDGPEAYGYGMELVVEGGVVTIYGHSGADPGVSAMVSHFVEPGLGIVVLCNQDRGSWAVVQRIVADLGLHDPRE